MIAIEYLRVAPWAIKFSSHCSCVRLFIGHLEQVCQRPERIEYAQVLRTSCAAVALSFVLPLAVAIIGVNA